MCCLLKVQKSFHYVLIFCVLTFVKASYFEWNLDKTNVPVTTSHSGYSDNKPGKPWNELTTRTIKVSTPGPEYIPPCKNNGTGPFCCLNAANNRGCCLDEPNVIENNFYLPPLKEKCCKNGGKGKFCCLNGAENPDCCLNNGTGKFCCTNGVKDNFHCCSNNGRGKYCCLNGANNPECIIPTYSTTKRTTTTLKPCPTGGFEPYCCSNFAKNKDCCLNNGKGKYCCKNEANNPDCCANGGFGKYCCLNGSNEPFCCVSGSGPYCCLNGERNRECKPTTTRETTKTTKGYKYTKPTGNKLFLV